MKTLSAAQEAALAASVKKPVWLLELELASADGAATLYLSDREVSLWGRAWKPLVLKWGAVDTFFDPSMSEVAVADVSLELDNTKGALGAGRESLGWHLRKYDLAASTATLYLWLDGAGLTEPSGQALNDLVQVMKGRPELGGEVTPAVCELDIVAGAGEFGGGNCPWGQLLTGRYTRNQWGSLPAGTGGGWKPAVFGGDVTCRGVALSGPVRAGKVSGPAGLFDTSGGAAWVEVTFPAGGEHNAAEPYPAPCDIYIGDWRFPVKSAPEHVSGGTWRYRIACESAFANYCLPTPLAGAAPFFTMSPGALWPRSDETGEGPYASAEPPMGTPYQFYHGPADTGNWRDGYNPGRAGRSVKSVYVDGVEAQSEDMTKDDAFGIVWLKRAACEVAGRAGNPETIRLQWTAVDQSFTSGDAWLGAGRLTARYPHGYNADAAPCVLGDFAVPASGGGAPASSKLGLVNSPRYPAPGARVASVRFVMRYTGVETSSGNFNLRIFGHGYSFASSELADGAGIEADGWTVSMDQKGTEFEIWPGNEGYPYTETSPDPRQWYVYELSRDVTADAKSHLEAFNGFADTFRAWFSGTVWPSTNSVIALGCYLEVSFDPVEAVIEGPEVTAVIGGPSSTAGEILGEVIPAEFVGSGFDDASLPPLKYHVDRPQTVCAFVRQVTRDSGTELLMNYDTGKYDLAARPAVRDSGNPPPGAGGVADISQDDLLADEAGLPVISRARSAPESVANEITVEYTSAEGRKESVTERNEGSIETHGLRKKTVVMGAGVGRAEAEARAREELGELSEPGDYYTMVFPLGPALALEPNDVLTVTADMDALNRVKMRAVSVEVAPGALADGEIATVTVNARRYDKARRGFGQTSFGSGPFGAGEVMEN